MKNFVTTNQIWIQMDPQIKLQGNSSFSPKPWMLEMEAIKKVQTYNDNIFHAFDNEHYQELHGIFEMLIHMVAREQTLENGQFVDNIDKRVADMKKKELQIQCLNCFIFYPKSKRVCDNCNLNIRESNKPNDTETPNSNKTNLNTSVVVKRVTFDGRKLKKSQSSSQSYQNERYRQVKSNHPTDHHMVTVAEPIFCNPLSIQDITPVLRKVGKDGGLHRYGGNKWHWIVVACDGLPFRSCNRIIHETYCCSLCLQSFFGEELYGKHCIDSHKGEKVAYFLEFDWVLLKPGGGHYEMNSVKAFVKLNWIPFFSELAHQMGFKTPKAQIIAKKCSDHHKAWQMLLIFYFGSLKELATSYVRDTLNSSDTIEETNDLLSTQEFFYLLWYKMTSNSNFMYLLNQVSLYAQAIVNFRMAMRHNNSQLAHCAIYKLSSLFHGRNHPFYQLIGLYYMVQQFLQPPEVKELVDRNFTISLSNDRSRGEDWDFILEGKNKIIKSWITKGASKKEYWITACRNTENLDILHAKQSKYAGISDVKPSYAEPHLEDAIEVWRTTLHRNEYFNLDEFCSINGVPLEKELLKFTQIALEKRHERIAEQYLGEDVDEDKTFFLPIFVTTDEKLEGVFKRKDTTIESIMKLIEQISCKVQKYFKDNLNGIRRKRLQDVVQFHGEIQDYLSTELDVNEDE